jgi:hypothetical protein
MTRCMGCDNLIFIYCLKAEILIERQIPRTAGL